MKLTCISSGDPSTPDVTTTFLLQFRGLRILLESPLHFTALRRFTPSYYPSLSSSVPSFDGSRGTPTSSYHFNGGGRQMTLASRSMAGSTGGVTGRGVAAKLASTLLQSVRERCLARKGDVAHMEGVCAESKAGLSEIGIRNYARGSVQPREARETPENSGPGFLKTGNHGLIAGEPKYLVPETCMIDVGCIDVVVISNPASMLLLPFLTKSDRFTPKIYATEVTAQIGFMMMSELVTLHDEHRQLYDGDDDDDDDDHHGEGRSFSPRARRFLSEEEEGLPEWLRQSKLETLDSNLNAWLRNPDGCAGSRWSRLYSQADISHCMGHISRLHYGEVVDVNGRVQISAHPSGAGLGCSNWMIRGSGKEIAYVAASLWGVSHAMPLDSSALCDADLMIAADIATEDEVELKHELDNGRRMQGGDAGGSLRMPGGSDTIRSGDVNGSVIDAKRMRDRLAGAYGWPDLVEPQEVLPPLTLVCRAAVRTVGRGGCALIPVGVCGEELQMFEVIAAKLNRLGYGHVQIFYISPIAEEALAYSNIIPEWVSPARQEKLDIPEASFGHHQLLQDKRLQHFTSLHCPELRRAWQEPCVVFAAHQSLRMGAVVDLIYRWRKDQRSTLILTEPSLAVEACLAPFQPMEMQTFFMPVSSKLRRQDVISLAEQSKPRKLLVPADVYASLKNSGSLESLPVETVQSYRGRQTIKIHQHVPYVKVEMDAKLAASIEMKAISRGIGETTPVAASISGVLSLMDGKMQLRHSLGNDSTGGIAVTDYSIGDVENPPVKSTTTTDMMTKRKTWILGQVDANKLAAALSRKGFKNVRIVITKERRGTQALKKRRKMECKERGVVEEAVDKENGGKCGEREMAGAEMEGRRIADGGYGSRGVTEDLKSPEFFDMLIDACDVKTDAMETDRVKEKDERVEEEMPRGTKRKADETANQEMAEVENEATGGSVSEDQTSGVSERKSRPRNQDVKKREGEVDEEEEEDEEVVVIEIQMFPKASIQIFPERTHIHADDAVQRQMLLEAVVQELQVL